MISKYLMIDHAYLSIRAEGSDEIQLVWLERIPRGTVSASTLLELASLAGSRSFQQGSSRSLKAMKEKQRLSDECLASLRSPEEAAVR